MPAVLSVIPGAEIPARDDYHSGDRRRYDNDFSLPPTGISGADLFSVITRS